MTGPTPATPDARAIHALLSDEWWPTYRIFEGFTHWPRKRIKAALEELAERGLAHYGPTVDQDGIPNGSGWFRSYRTPPWDGPQPDDLPVCLRCWEEFREIQRLGQLDCVVKVPALGLCHHVAEAAS